MANQAETCRQKANECARLAGHVADSHGRVLLRETATLWRRIAQSMEAREEIERNSVATADLVLSTTQATKDAQIQHLHLAIAKQFLGPTGFSPLRRWTSDP